MDNKRRNRSKSQNNQNNPQSTQRYQHNDQQFQSNQINDDSYQQVCDSFTAVYGNYDVPFTERGEDVIEQ